MPPDNPLLALDNVVLMPHVAWLTPETLDRSLDVAIENMRRLRDGASCCTGWLEREHRNRHHLMANLMPIGGGAEMRTTVTVDDELIADAESIPG